VVFKIRHLTETEYILIKKKFKRDNRYVIFDAKKIFKMAAMWTCVALLYSQKILFSKILNLTPRAI
jgi:hypothetical protein